MLAHGLQNSPIESNLYVKCVGDVFVVIVLYVDDMLFAGPNETHIAHFKDKLNFAFEMLDLGLLHHSLGIQFMHIDGGIALCQTKHIETLLQHFGLEDCKPIAIPMEIGLQLSLIENSLNK